MTGHTEAEVLGTNCRILPVAGTAPEVVGAIRKALADSSSAASRMIVDWLVREIRSGA